MEEGEERNRFIELIAVQMKKNYQAWNKDNVEDKRIFDDLRICSNGKIDIADGVIRINQQQPRNDNAQRNNKRKKIFKKKY